ncbi:hypothetical protein FQZ97_913850 [compost metagenome]
MQRSRQCDVVDVMACGASQGALLPPTSHATVDERWIRRQSEFRPQPQALHHSWSKTFQQHISPGDQLQCRLTSFWFLQVEGNRSSPARLDAEGVAIHSSLAVDSQYFSPHVRQEHGAKRPRPHTGELEHPDSTERSLSLHDRTSNRCRRTTTPEPSRSQVSAVTPCPRSSCLSTLCVGVLGSSCMKRR